MRSVIGALHAPLVFDRRTRVLAGHLAALLPAAADVVDVGCGDGTISALIAAPGPTRNYAGSTCCCARTHAFRWSCSTGTTLPLADDSADTVMFVDVLHHTVDPMVLCVSRARCAASGVDKGSHHGRPVCRRAVALQWTGSANAPHGVVLPYNYWPERRWRAASRHSD